MKKTFSTFLLAIFFFASTAQTGQKKILIRNVRVFNGIDNKLIKADVIVDGPLIVIIDTAFQNSKSRDFNIIDGKGGYLIPGLIDAHSHLLLESLPITNLFTSDIGFMNLYASYFAEKQLLRGFTTVRDMGGNTFALAKAIDMGLIKGPRVFPSGAAISQTGGHGDFDLPTAVSKLNQESYLNQSGITAIADGYDQVLTKAREQLRQGATQIKLCAGGGIISFYDPIDVSQYTEQEMRAAVETAENWGTYVTVHAYNNTSVQRAIAAGVKCIEHGQLIDESTAKLFAEKNIWWSLQPFLNDSDATPFPEGSSNWKKQQEVIKGTDNAYMMAKKYNIKIAFGTDQLFDSTIAKNQGRVLTKLKHWFSPYEILKMATHDNASLLSLCGKRNPYQLGKIGEITEGAYADLIIVDSNPLENIDLVADPTGHFKLIMKNGVVYKNELNVKSN